MEAPFNVGQISPRVFECAAMMTPMILFRGSYSNAIEADVHYIALEKDFSNADAILARLDDLEYLQGFADRAYQQLVRSGKYGYRSLGRLVANTIEEQYPLRIDPEWVAYRARTARQLPLERPAKNGRAESQWAAFAERPTDLPLSVDAFKERQAKIATPAEDRAFTWLQHCTTGMASSTSAGSAHHSAQPLALCYNIARPGWHLLPQHLRYAIVRWLGW